MRRPRPVLIYAAVMAGLTALTGYAGLDQLIPSQAVAWLALVTVVVGAVGGVLVQSQVTPLSAPRSADGRELMPAPHGPLCPCASDPTAACEFPPPSYSD